MSFFGNALGQISGNPFSTPVGSRIEQATDDTLASENWALNMEICDLVNETEEGPRDAVKAIRKRLNQNAGKNYTVVMYTLTVLETCVKNCGRRFHLLICNKDFVLDLVKLIGPKNDPPTAVQEKVLSLIQSWADAFKNQGDMNGVVQVYQDLLAKGIEFPATDLDAMAPIHTPQRSVDSEPLVHQGVEIVAPPQPLPPMQPAQSPVGLGPDQRAKIQSELDVVQGNLIVFGEMLSEMKPGEEQPDELELLQELYVTCQTMQERLVDLISKLSNDELTADLLRINDDLNNLFLRYSRWEKNREGGKNSSSASQLLAKSMPPAKPKLQPTDSLIDFEDDLPEQLSKLSTAGAATSAASQLSNIQTVTAQAAQQQPQGGDDFDMFAQSRNATYENTKARTSYKDNLEPDQIKGGLSTATQAKQSTVPDLEFDEMEHWLGQTTGGEESVTSSEFERFLAERAAAADQLPSVTGSTNGNAQQRQQQPSQKKDEKQLYAL